MAEATIQAIIDVEKELQRKIALEEEKIAEWLDEKRQEVASDIDRQEKDFQEDQKRQEEKKIGEIAAKADQIMQEAKLERARLEQISQDEIERIVNQHLAKILPG